MLGEWLGLDHEFVAEEREDVSISVSGSPGELRLPDVFLAAASDRWLRPESLPAGPLPVWTVDEALRGATLVDGRLPVLFGREVAPGTYFRPARREATLGLDVFGTAFFMVTRYEEALPGERDAHDRFPAAASVAVREGFSDRPIVNEYVEVLWSALRQLWPGIERASRSARFLPSHDIDTAFSRESSLSQLARRLASDVVRKLNVGLAGRRLRVYSRGPGVGSRHDLSDTYDDLMALSEHAGTRSAFYFFGQRTGLPIDAAYTPSDAPVRAVLRRIGERGHEIGLHASYSTYRQTELIGPELDALREACAAEGIRQESWGSRQHYLRWETPTTWQGLEEAGVDYDTTLGFSSIGGFRAGCCYEFPVFNVRTRKELRLRERPLVVMEVALLDRQGLSHAEAVDRASELRRRCELFRGDFTLLWHNTRLQSAADRDAYMTLMGARGR